MAKIAKKDKKINEQEVQKVQELMQGFIPESDQEEESNESKSLEDLENLKKEEKPEKEEDKIFHALNVLASSLEIEPLEIYLPGFKKKAIVYPLTSEDELFLNTARLSFETFMTKVNKIIFEKLELDGKKATELFPSLEIFLQYLLPIDRALIIFGIIKVSFDSLSPSEFICQNCGESFIEELNVLNLEIEYDPEAVKNLKKIDFYSLKEEIEAVPNTLRITLGFNPEDIRLKIMELENDQSLKSNINNNNILSFINNVLYFLKKIEILQGKKVIETFEMPEFLPDDDEETLEFKEKQFKELVTFLYKMPLKIQDALLQRINIESLEKFIPKFLFKLPCPFCGKINDQVISPEIEFFRKTLSYSG
jgi:hypothetical protein